MDILYIGDIPKEYHYAVFGSNYIDLYNTPTLQGNLDYYRIYMYDNQFAYDLKSITYNQYNYSIAKDINVTDNYMYRRDFPSVMFMSATYIIMLVILFNIVSSVFKRGGLLSGLL